MRPSPLSVCLAVSFWLGCGPKPSAPGEPPVPIPAFRPAPLGLRRLTAYEYRGSLGQLLDTPVAAAAVEPDARVLHFSTVGASSSALSPLAVERLEALTLSLVEPLFADSARRLALVGCTPSSAADPCLRRFVERFTARAFRRPAQPAQTERYLALVSNLTQGADALELWDALGFTTAAILQSPDFLYLVEHGEPDPADPSRLRLTAPELAARLSLFLVGSGPDSELTAAAASGTLVDAAPLRQQAERLVASPAWRERALELWRELLDVPAVGQLQKSPAVTATLLPALREELELQLRELVAHPEADVRQLFTRRETFVDAELAGLYGLTAPSGSGFSRQTLPPGPRAGLFGTGAFLALNAHAANTSPARRGLFVRERLLCESVSPPPAGVDTSLPPPAAGTVDETLRARLERHRGQSACAGCHDLLDPIGFGLEAFDTVGRYREQERGLPIDSRGALDGKPFQGAAELGALLAADPRVTDCLARQVYRFAGGRRETAGEGPAIDGLAAGLRQSGHSLWNLFIDAAMSEGFRTALPPEEGDSP